MNNFSDIYNSETEVINEGSIKDGLLALGAILLAELAPILIEAGARFTKNKLESWAANIISKTGSKAAAKVASDSVKIKTECPKTQKYIDDFIAGNTMNPVNLNDIIEELTKTMGSKYASELREIIESIPNQKKK